jgi:hypothetical protein
MVESISPCSLSNLFLDGNNAVELACRQISEIYHGPLVTPGGFGVNDNA